VKRESSLVSVIVPTVGRPDLVTRAVCSALAQDLKTIEVIVVLDGPSPATAAALGQIEDERLRVLELARRIGLGGARNAGIQEACSEWVAFLDDDDEWLPSKLELQLHTARGSRFPSPIVSCRFIHRRRHGDVVRPPRAPENGEPMSEYLFCRKRLLTPEGTVLPSTILAPTALARRVPFRYAQFAHEGSDWLLRATACEGVGIEFVPTREPLAIWHADGTHDRISDSTDWHTALAWVETNANLLTAPARASFILIRVGLMARRARSLNAFCLLIREAFRQGRPTWTSLGAYFAVWLVPERARSIIARWCRGRRRPSPRPPTPWGRDL
jgi:glycosyltransferase involved in cell wall biosynthesis